MSSNLVISAGLIVDGREPLAARPGWVVVRDGVITEVVASSDRPLAPLPEGELIEAGDLTLMPAMIDGHVHMLYDVYRPLIEQAKPELDHRVLLTGVQNAALALAAGVTTVRDLGGKNALVFALRSAARSAVIAGPTILASGAPITTRRGHCWYFGLEADTAHEVRQAVVRQVADGVDLIKVIASGGRMTPGSAPHRNQYPLEVLRALVEEAHGLGHRVASHASATEAMQNSAIAGVDTIEHCAWYGPEEGSFRYEQSVVDIMAAKGVYANHATLPHPFFFKPDSALSGQEREWLQTSQRRWEALHSMAAAGVHLMLSTDAVYGLWPDGSDLARAAEVLVARGGFTPVEVVPMVTRVPAEALGLGRELGTVEAGKRANLLLVEGNPLEDITALRRPRLVIQSGKVVARSGQLSIPPKTMPAAVREVPANSNNPWIS